MAKKFETPKGTRDYLPSDMRDRATEIMKRHGGRDINTASEKTVTRSDRDDRPRNAR